MKTLWTTELVPGPWRSGDIVNIFKKGDKKDPGNYRGITLLNVMGKLYTKVIDSRFQPALPLPEASQQPPLPADLRPVLVMDWDPIRPWHPRHMGPQARAGDADAVPAQPQPQPQLAISPHLVGAWSAGVIDPGFGSEPAHEYVVRTRASRLRTLRRIIAGLPDAVSSMRPAIWPAEYGDEHSGIRRLESRWAAAWDHR